MIDYLHLSIAAKGVSIWRGKTKFVGVARREVFKLPYALRSRTCRKT
jgi:hypothetical protein